MSPEDSPGGDRRSTTWETSRAWHLIRPLVYYLVEDFIPPEMARGSSVLDFSAGLGDLGRYLVDSGAQSVTATIPEPSGPNRADPRTEWLTGVAAGNVADRLHGRVFDLVSARMVFQFPTWEGDRSDPDTLTEELHSVLRPGGRLALAFHEFIPFETMPPVGEPPEVGELLTAASPGQAAIVRYLGLPPREGPLGESGFGLKVPMLVSSLQGRGFDIEIADHPEPFTFPHDIESLSEEALAELGRQVFEVKRRHLGDPGLDPYSRPGVVRRMLAELEGLFRFTTWPIVRIIAVRR